MKKQNLSLWHAAFCQFASVLLLFLLLAVLPDSAVKAQTTPQHELSISLSNTSIAEGNSKDSIVATATVSASNALNFTVSVDLCITGTATEGTDYTLIESNTTNQLTSLGTKNCSVGGYRRILNPSLSSWQFRIRVSGDGTIENDETVIISIVAFGNNAEDNGKVGISPTSGSAIFTIEDDDSPTAAFASATSSADEDDGTVTVAVNLSANATMNTDVAYSVSGTAASATDFSALSKTVQITSGSKTANISIPIIDDEADEPSETVILTLSDSFGYKVGTPNVHTLTINDDDAAPSITSAATKSVAENTTAVLIVTATDTDDNDDDLTYSISGGADSARFSIDRSDGDLAFKTAPDFETPGDQGGDNDYEVIVTASDGTNNTAQTITVNVTNVNDNDPMLAPTATASVAENTTTVLTVTATDEDAGTTLTYSISGGADIARFSINQSTGDLTFKTAPDFENASADGDDDYEVIVTASDGDNSVMQTITVTVTDVNDNDPVITSDATATVAENTTDVLTVTATDADAGAVIRYSISGGADRSLFSIDANSGVLTFITAPDFEGASADGDDDYEVIVMASDGDNSIMQTITVTVTDVNDNDPMITSAAAVSVPEGTTTVLTVTATDADAGTILTYSISGGTDRALFSINRTSGALTFTTAPDFEALGSTNNSNVYEVAITASDGTNNAMQTITITVTNDPSDDILGFSQAEETIIFPNPSGRYLEVRSLIGGTFKILSLSGKPLLKGPTNTRVDITSLCSGLYLVQLPDGRLLKFVRE